MTYNVLRIYEVRLNEISNYKQMLVGVSCIYAVISCKNYGYDRRFNFMDKKSMEAANLHPQLQMDK